MDDKNGWISVLEREPPPRDDMGTWTDPVQIIVQNPGGGRLHVTVAQMHFSTWFWTNGQEIVGFKVLYWQSMAEIPESIKNDY